MHIGNFFLEDFQKKKDFLYIHRRNDTNVLNSICFEPSHRIEIVKSVVLSVKKCESEYFFTDFHVKWALECTGFAFSLPLEYSSTISQAISIYYNWLTVPQKRPSLIGNNESYYQVEMIGHLSLLFIDRPFDTVHVELCAQVLKIIRVLIRKQILFQENYPFLLKILLLSFNHILENTTEFSKKIGGDISRVLFESFIRSEIRDHCLWKDMIDKFSHWVTNTEVNLSWVSVTLALTNRIVQFLYGELNPDLSIEFKDEGFIKIQISIPHCILSWNYFLINVLENTVKEMFDPQTHKEFVRSVSKIAEVFIKFSINRYEISTNDLQTQFNPSSKLEFLINSCESQHLKYKQNEGTLPIPNAASLINIFGDWLFTQSRMNSGGAVYGHAEAIATICRIYCNTSRPIPDNYLGKFYQLLFKHFKYANESNFQVAGSILSHSVKILTQEYKGVRILLHKSCIFKILEIYVKSKDISSQIKRDCYCIISAIVPAMKPYKKHGVISILNECLLYSVNAETEPENLVLLFWSVCAYVCIIDDSDVLEGFVRALVKKVVVPPSVEKACFLECLKVISVLPFMVLSEDLVNAKVVKDLVVRLVIPLLGKNVRGTMDATHFYSLNLLLHWTMKFPKYLKDTTARYQLFETLAILKNFERDKEYTLLVESYIMNYAGKFLPEIRFPFNNNSIITPTIWGSESSRPIKNYLYKSDTLLSIYNVENGVVIIIRNKTGKFVWKFVPVIGPAGKKKLNKFEMKKVEILKSPKFLTSEPAKVNELIKDLKISEVVKYEKFLRLFKKSEKNVHNFTYEEKTRVQETPVPELINLSSHRALFSGLGMFNPDLITDLSVLTGPSVDQLIEELDNIIDNELYIFPILYLHTPESPEWELTIKQDSYPIEFITLINSFGLHLTQKSLNIGVSLSIQEIVGKYGGLIYNKEYYFETVALTPALFNNDVQVKLEDLLNKNQITVIWNQRYAQPDTLKVPFIVKRQIFLKKTLVLLTPLTNFIVRVNFYGSNCGTGPLVDNMIVPVYLLGKLICMTVASAYSYSTSKIATSMNKSTVFNRMKECAKETDSNGLGRTSSVLSYTFKN